MAAKARTVGEYLARVSGEKRTALQALRRVIKSAVPGGQECISYAIPAIRYNGRVLVWYHASTNHCSFFPGSRPIAAHKKELARYETSKGTVRFTPAKPLPATLVRKLIRTRMAEVAAKG